MTLEEIKAEVANLSPEDIETLIGFANCLAVMRDPEWLAAIEESTARHECRLPDSQGRSMRVAEDTR